MSTKNVAPLADEETSPDLSAAEIDRQQDSRAPGALRHARERVAIHEAGHAVLSCHLRVPFRRVTIKRSAQAEGTLVSQPWPVSIRPDVGDPRSDRRVESEVMIFFGGSVAEVFAFGAESEGAESDYEKIGMLIGYISGSADDEWRRQTELRARAEGYLKSLWPAVEAVADALSQRGTLTAAEVRRIYRGATAKGAK